ncbi:Abnormal spindle-like microcephaly-associated [Amphibalanus amphitrite]|uniref:Abnormal spindle-like microcephaly-associated n=1 Tax=Amphibalanus amphitrite TaxID=1232801 RepID=A0A6A4WEX6_AMPAM|nr:Abnormal spindle-like microcephaly-associated [Amphibalanus amphitrite]
MATRGVSFEVRRTPPDRRAPRSPEQVPVLQLRRFAPTPKVSFGTVRVGATRTIGLIVQNPADTELELYVDKVPDGFAVEVPSLLVPALMDAVLAVHWTPEQEGNVRGVLGVSTSTGVRAQAILLGTGRPLQAAKKKKSVASAPGARFRKPQPLRSLNSSSAGRSAPAAAAKPPAKTRAGPPAERENRPPRAAGRPPAQPAGLLCPPAAGPLNSTHRLETSADCSTLLDVLRTPPDFSVSLIRSEEAPGTPARRRDGRAARPPAAAGDVTPRRQTFEVPAGAPMGCTFRLDPPPAQSPERDALPPCTVPESPLRRQTFIRTDGPTLGAAPTTFCLPLEPLEEGDQDAPADPRNVFETPQLFRRRQPAAAERRQAAETAAPADQVSPDDWMRTPSLFGKTAGGEARQERTRRRERRSCQEERSDRETVEVTERTERSGRQSHHSVARIETAQLTEHSSTRARPSIPAEPEAWMKTPSLFGKTTSRSETRTETRERRETRDDIKVTGTESQSERFETRGGVRFEVRDDASLETHEERRHESRGQRVDVREEERFGVRETVRSDEYDEVFEGVCVEEREVYEERVQVREERCETVEYVEECQEYVAVQSTDDGERVIQTPQLFAARHSRSDQQPESSPSTGDDSVSEPTHEIAALRQGLMSMPTPQLFGRSASVTSSAETRATSRRATRSETLASSTSTTSSTGDIGSPAAGARRAAEERATCVHEEVVEEETLIRHVFSREVVEPAPGQSPRLLRSSRSSRTEETRCYGSPARGGRPDLTAVLGSPRLTPTAGAGGRRCSTLVKEPPAEQSPSAGAQRSAIAKELFGKGAPAGESDAAAALLEPLHVDVAADALSDVSGNLSSETYVKSPAPSGLAVPCVSPPPLASASWSADAGGALSLIREESENVTSTSTRNLTFSLEETREEAPEVPDTREASVPAGGEVPAQTGGSVHQETQSGGSDGSWATVVDGYSTAAGEVTESLQQISARELKREQATEPPQEAERSQGDGPAGEQAQEPRAAAKPHLQRPTGLLFFPLSPESEPPPPPPPGPRPPVQPSARAMAVAAARRSVSALSRREAAGREAAGRSQQAAPPPRSAKRAARTPSKPRARRPSLTVTPGKARVVRTKSSPNGAAGKAIDQ